MLGGLIESFGRTFGYDTALIVGALAVVDYAQLRYLSERINNVGNAVDGVEKRVERVEDTFIVADGGTRPDNESDD